MMSLAKIGSLALFLLFALQVQVQVFGADVEPTLTVVLTPGSIKETESVQLRIEVEAGRSQVIFQPTFDAPDFILVGSQPNYGGSATTKYISGQNVPTKKSYFEFVLSPKRTGNLMIQNIRTKVGDKEFTHNDVAVTVTPDAQAPRSQIPDDGRDSSNPAAPNYGAPAGLATPPDEIPARFNSDFTVHASVNKRRAYVGEPIIVEYWLYDYGDLRQMEVQKWPSFDGFWKDDLEITTRFEFDELYLRNERMRRAFLGRYALFGINPGKIAIDQLVIRGQYVSNRVQRGWMQVQEYRTGIHGSQEVIVEILPLPAAGKPKNFSGAVGQFLLKVEADKTNVLQNTPVTFTITVQGVGNFQAIDSIRLPLPPNFEVYDTKTGARGANPIGIRRELYSTKTFQVTALPRKAGSFTVNPIEWWYFDPELAAYKKASTSPIEIHVQENEAAAQANNTYAAPGAAPAPPAEEIVPLKAVDLSAPQNTTQWLNVSVGLAGILNAFLAFLWVRRRADGYMKEIFKDPFQEARSRFAQAQKAKDASWLSGFEETLFAIVETLQGSNPRGITRAELETQWREAGLPAPLFHQISLVLDRLDQHRFSNAKSKATADRKKFEREVAEILKEASKLV